MLITASSAVRCSAVIACLYPTLGASGLGYTGSGMMNNQDDVVELLLQNWRAEIQSARMYRELAQAEKDPKRKAVLFRMAEAEDRHAARWAKKLKEHGVEPAAVDNWKQRLNRWWNRRVG